MSIAPLDVWLLLPAAFALDMAVGDPRRLPHPIRWMGAAIQRAEARFRGLPPGPVTAGGAFALTLILGTWAVAAATVALAAAIHPVLGAAAQVTAVFYSLSTRSLGQAARGVQRALAGQSLETARRAVAMIVGRDTRRLSAGGVARATVETVAENLVDGVVAPLCFAALGGGPLALAYKMVNTLDSMVGYKNPRYIRFGRVAARIDDAANFLPARLAVPLIALAARLLDPAAGPRAWRTARRDGRRHTSPNAGLSEAAFAGALQVRLGGPNVYHGRLVEKPYIGGGFGAVDARAIPRAVDLLDLTAALAMAVLTVLRGVLHG